MKKTTFLLLFLLFAFHVFPQQQDINNNFISATRAEDLDKIIELLDKGADLNYRDDQDFSALHYAVQLDNPYEISAFLIERGTDLNHATGAEAHFAGYTALHFAVQREDGYKTTKLLIDNGADVNMQTADAGNRAMYSALHFAAMNKNGLELTKLLVNAGADIDRTAKNGATALHIASVNTERFEIAKLLIDNGADINIKAGNFAGYNNYTAMHYAVRRSNNDLVLYLIEKGVNIKAEEYKDLLHIASRERNEQIVRLLLDYDFDVNSTDYWYQQTPLILAAWSRNNTETLKLLLDNGANINTTDKDGLTPLLRVQNCFENLRFLLDNGADVNARDNNGYSALHRATWVMDIDVSIFELLLSYGAKINLQDNNGFTPLHSTVRQNYDINVTELLIKHGANVNLKSYDDSIAPIHRASKYNSNIATIKLLINSGADYNAIDANGNSVLHYAAKNINGKEIIDFFINKGLDVNAKNTNGFTPLHFAAQNKNGLEIVQSLINAGAEINYQTSFESPQNPGYTALHFAAETGNILTSAYLLLNSADVNIKDSRAHTPIQIAENFSQNYIQMILSSADYKIFAYYLVDDIEGIKEQVLNSPNSVLLIDVEGKTVFHRALMDNKSEVFNLLFENKINPNIIDNRGQTLLHWALFLKNEEDALRLIESGADINIADNYGYTAYAISELKELTKTKYKLLELNADTIYNIKPELSLNRAGLSPGNIIKYSPDGFYFVLTRYDRMLTIHDSQTGMIIRTITANQGRETSIAFADNGKSLITGGSDGTLKLWDIHTGQLLRNFSGQVHKTEQGRLNRVNTIQVSNNHRYFISAFFDKSIMLWDIATGSIINTFEGHEHYVNTISFLPDNRSILTGGGDEQHSELLLWDIESGQIINSFTGHTRSIRSISISKDGQSFISSGRDNIINLWNIKSGEIISSIEENAFKVEFFNNDEKLITNQFGAIKIWEIPDFQLDKSINITDPKHNDIFSVTPDDKTLISFNNSNIFTWDIESGFITNIFKDNTRLYRAVDISKLNQKIYTNSGIIEKTHFGHYRNKNLEITQLTLTSDNENMIFIERNENQWWRNPVFYNIFCFDSDTIIPAEYEHTYPLSSIAVSICNQYVVSGSFAIEGQLGAAGFLFFKSNRGEIRLSSLQDREKVLLIDNIEPTTSLSFDNSGKTFASGHNISDSTIMVKLWNTQSGELELGLNKQYSGLFSWNDFMLNYVNNISFSSDDNYIAASCVFLKGIGFDKMEPEIIIWDLQTQEILNTFTGHTNVINSISFTQDDKKLLSASSDKTLKLWDIQTGNSLTFEGHTAPVLKAELFDNDSKIISVAQDGVIIYWDSESTDIIATVYQVTDSSAVVVTPDGYFDGEPHALQHLYYVEGMDIIPLAAFYEEFFRPNLLSRLLNNESIEKSNINFLRRKPDVGVKITEPEPGMYRGVRTFQSTSENMLTVKAEFTDRGGGIDEVRIYRNSKLVSSERLEYNNPGTVLTRSFDISLMEGINTIVVSGFNSDRTEITDTVRMNFTGRITATPNLYVLAVGIDEYLNPQFNLNYAVKDAEVFANSLQQASKTLFGKIESRVVTNQNATTDNIISAFNEIQSIAEPWDVFVFYYAGHGVAVQDKGRTNFYFINHNVTNMFSPEHLNEHALSDRDLFRFSRDIQAEKQFIVIDACHSGAAASEILSYRSSNEEQRALAVLARSTGTHFLFASTSEQLAAEIREVGHGLFTYSILEALSGGGGKFPAGRGLTVREISSYAERMVPELSKQFVPSGMQQFPTAYSFGHDFPLVISGKVSHSIQLKGKFDDYSDRELRRMLRRATDAMEFEKAIEIRDELEKRKK